MYRFKQVSDDQACRCSEDPAKQLYLPSPGFSVMARKRAGFERPAPSCSYRLSSVSGGGGGQGRKRVGVAHECQQALADVAGLHARLQITHRPADRRQAYVHA
jgi:hypothetical protein